MLTDYISDEVESKQLLTKVDKVKVSVVTKKPSKADLLDSQQALALHILAYCVGLWPKSDARWSLLESKVIIDELNKEQRKKQQYVRSDKKVDWT